MAEKKIEKNASAYPIVVFADGASSGNPGPGGWGTIIATPDGRVWELGGFAPDTTNNQMELMAVIQGLRKLQDLGLQGLAGVYTDSVYVIRGITQWSWAWRKNHWKTSEGKEVANVPLWKQLIALMAQRGKENPVKWHFVRGHSGIAGNERVDEIAVAFSKGRGITLYQGALLSYRIAIHDIPANTDLPEMKPKQEAKPAAHSYLSLLGSTPMRHSSWADCERRVKGQSGAKFKKAMTAEEEAKILLAWGYQLKDLRS